LLLRRATEADLEFVLSAEADPEVAPFIVRWSAERHRRAMEAADEESLIVADGERPVGFALLAGLEDPNRVVELRRIVIVRRGEGIGRRALEMLLERAFVELGAHRVWLDVRPHNERARRAYAAVGFVEEGLMRDAARTPSGDYEPLILMSMLEPEWRERASS
jgi:diamine N-acetyltransferase